MKPGKPPARLSNLFGLIDPQKLQSLFGGVGSYPADLPYNPRYARQTRLETIPEVSDSMRGSGDGEGVGLQGEGDYFFAHYREKTIIINNFRLNEYKYYYR